MLEFTIQTPRSFIRHHIKFYLDTSPVMWPDCLNAYSCVTETTHGMLQTNSTQNGGLWFAAFKRSAFMSPWWICCEFTFTQLAAFVGRFLTAYCCLPGRRAYKGIAIEQLAISHTQNQIPSELCSECVERSTSTGLGDRPETWDCQSPFFGQRGCGHNTDSRGPEIFQVARIQIAPHVPSTRSQ
jgi:hypothetical protein